MPHNLIRDSAIIEEMAKVRCTCDPRWVCRTEFQTQYIKRCSNNNIRMEGIDPRLPVTVHPWCYIITRRLLTVQTKTNTNTSSQTVNHPQSLMSAQHTGSDWILIGRTKSESLQT